MTKKEVDLCRDIDRDVVSKKNRGVASSSSWYCVWWKKDREQTRGDKLKFPFCDDVIMI